MGLFRPPTIEWDRLQKRLQQSHHMRQLGTVVQVVGLVIESRGPAAALGELCLIDLGHGDTIPTLVVGFRDERTLLMPLGETTGIRPGCIVAATGGPPKVSVSDALLGRILNGLGQPVDSGPPLFQAELRNVEGTPPDAYQRSRITRPVATGVRALDGLMTLGDGQRMGIFAGSGVGKSTLMGMIARNTSADVNVIALVGERGREVREFIERDLGEEGLGRSVVVVSTSDAPALQRIQATYLAMSIAEHFRDEGHSVMLMMDSLTRFATALREVGLAVGEPPTTRGYTPSVFATLPRLLERAGPGIGTGNITGLFTILVENDDVNEPIGDAVRAILDGHVVLSRDLAARNHYPAIDVLGSVSRVMVEVADPEHIALAQEVRRLLAVYAEAEDLVNIGAYQRGSNPEIDEAIQRLPDIRKFLQQDVGAATTYEQTVERLKSLCPNVRQAQDRNAAGD